MPLIKKICTRSGAKQRIFCFPYAGGNAEIYSNIAPYIPEDFDIYSIQPPGRSERFCEKPFSCMKEYVDQFLKEFKNLSDLPFVLFGHSLGGLVVYSIANTLRNQDLPGPRLMVVSACRVPSSSVTILGKSVETLTDNQFTERLREIGGTPIEVLDNTDLMQLLLPMLRSDFSLAEESFEFGQEPLSCNGLVLYGSHDTGRGLNEVSGWYKAFDNTEFIEVPGDHFFVKKDPKTTFLLIKDHLNVI